MHAHVVDKTATIAATIAATIVATIVTTIVTTIATSKKENPLSLSPSYNAREIFTCILLPSFLFVQLCLIVALLVVNVAHGCGV